MARAVRDEGRLDAKLVLIGEAPGQREEAQGRPFVGPSGIKLAKWWEEVGLCRKDFYITNVYPYRPLNNKIETIGAEEMEHWIELLHERLSQLTDPYIIIPTGNTALKALTGKSGILKYRGSILTYPDLVGRNLKCIPTLHPAFVLRDPSMTKRCLIDWAKIARESKTRTIVTPERTHIINPDIEEIIQYSDQIDGNDISIDIETNPNEGEILCVGFAQSIYRSFTIPTTLSYWGNQDDLNAAWCLIRSLCDLPNPKVLQNGFYDCLPGNAEVLSPDGWCRLNRLPTKRELLIAQWHPSDGKITWTKPKALIKKPYNGDLVCFKTRAVTGVFTPTHRIVHQTQQGWEASQAQEIVGKRIKIPISGILEGSVDLPWIRLLVAIQADAHITSTRASFNLKKTRKIERLLKLCEKFGVRVREIRRSNGERSFALFGPLIKASYGLLGKDRDWGSWLLDFNPATRQNLIEELAFWDSHQRKTSFRYSTKSPNNARWIATICHVTGYAATQGRAGVCATVNIRKRQVHDVCNENWSYRRFEGKHVYCVSVESSFFLVRYKNTIFITGNCYWLSQVDSPIRNFKYDTMLMHHCIDSKEPHALGHLTSIYTDQPYHKEMYKDPETVAKWGSVFNAFLAYNGLDCCVTLEISRKLQVELQKEGKTEFYFKHYRDLFEPTMSLMLHGMKVESKRRKLKFAQLRAKCIGIEDQLEKIAGEKLHAKKGLSSKRIQRYLYETLKIAKVFKRGRGTVTADEVTIRKLILRHPKKLRVSGQLILDHRKGKKLSEFLEDTRLDDDGRIRCSYGLNTSTGRFKSSKNPKNGGANMQNPSRECRDIFLPDDGMILLEGDLSQAESRVVGCLTGDVKLIELAKSHPAERDVHTENAAFIFKISESDITKKQRYLGKRAIHAGNYGMKGFTLSDILLKDGTVLLPAECQGLIDSYMEKYPAIPEWQRSVRLAIMRKRMLTNDWGRTISFEHDRLTDNIFREGYAFVPQSDIAELTNQFGLIPVYWFLKKNGFRAKINLQVHDALVISTPPDEAYDIAVFMAASMQRPVVYAGTKLSIPVEFKLGTSWKCEHEFKRLPSRKEFTEIAYALLEGK